MNTTTAAPVGGVASSSPALLVGVRTTRVYCRPDCPALGRAKAGSRVSFDEGAEARAAGFRPCRVCRPDAVETIRHGVGPSPLGHVLVALSDRGIVALYLLDSDDPAPAVERLRRDFPQAALVEDSGAVAPMIARAVAHVCDGRPCDDLPLDLRGTPFQLRVWDALRAIPRGRTTSYGELARSLGLPVGAARAVGTACGTNPVSLIVPCHRVVRAGGGLGGYYWGLDVKRRLLEIEQTAGSGVGWVSAAQPTI
jgi:AraC family transcriptional regulator of adaptative response/methylated-DNA-[protein]-cysteine methyltransferase